MRRALGNYKYVFIGLMGFVAMSCQPQHKEKAKESPKKMVATSPVVNEEDQVVKLIMELDEVKRANAQVEKASKGKRHLSTYIETSPTVADPNYWIKVAEDNGSNYVTYYTFGVDSKTRKISYYDPIQDSLMSLSQWRETPMAER